MSTEQRAERLAYQLRRTRAALAVYVPGKSQPYTPTEWVARSLNVPLTVAAKLIASVEGK